MRCVEEPSWRSNELSIGELSARSGVAESALRYYEREGLIHSRRTTGNQRRYDRRMLRHVAFIKASQSLGIPLSSIARVLRMLPEGAPATKEFWEKASECWSADLNERIKKMERLRDRFTQCIACGCLSFDECALINPEDSLSAQGPGPRRLLDP
jgi:MerR family redox-sensitive transcriptional activator SoxR